MNKGKIKAYAVGARKRLINDIKQKAYETGIEENNIKELTKIGEEYFLDDKLITKDKKIQRDKIIKHIKEIGYDEVINESAYTWFNRFIALRYMEVNNYLSIGRILSSEDEYKKEPQALREVLNFKLPLNKEKVIELKEKNMLEELYKYILIVQCNELSKVLPFIFEKKNDYTELLLPDNLLNDDSIIKKLIQNIDEEDFKEVEIIGWLYQFYISEKKEEIFTSLSKSKKITKEEIAPATQLFTPKWVVKYMVENSLGRLWIEHDKDKSLKENWRYYLEDNNNVKRKDSFKIEEIKVLDPACGSGHILVYAFEILYEMYLKEGYEERSIPKLIIENNLYGLEIDYRAAQLAAFSIIMKGREKYKRFFKHIEKEGLNINIVNITESNFLAYGKEVLIQGKDDKYAINQVENLINTFNDGKEYGSIINVENFDVNFWRDKLKFINNIEPTLDNIEIIEKLKERLPNIMKQAFIMSQKYDVVVANPPYMGYKNMNKSIITFLKKYYKDNKEDLFSVFIERGFEYLKPNGFNAMVTMQSWMFLSSFKKFRENLLKEASICTLTHMDNMVMGIAFGTCATVWRKKYIPHYEGIFNYVELKDINKDEEVKEFPVKNNRYNILDNDSFKLISDSPIAYWTSENVRNIFKHGKLLSDIAELKQGLATGDNKRFLRYWYEVDINNIQFNCKSLEESKLSDLKWFPCNKGGEYRKWYGNNYYVVNWENNGEEIKNNVIKRYPYLNGNYKFVVKNEQYYFKKGLTWSSLTSGNLSVRYSKEGFIFETKGSVCFPKDYENIYYILAYLNSKLANHFIKMITPTFDYHEGPMGKLPLILYKNDIIENLVKENISICKNEWDSYETSWEFTKNPLLMFKDEEGLIEKSYNEFKNFKEKQFNKLKENEELINENLINLYGIENEMSKDVLDEEVSINKANLEKDIKDFISYAVGCIMGRYSLDKDGLVYAGGEFKDNLYLKFKPSNGTILISDGEYFENDIVSRFIEFITIVFGKKSLVKNLEFISNVLGKKNNELPIDAIRRYFLNDFYKDHLKLYKKKPIYWFFTSGKEKGFNLLLYIHRYDKQMLSKIRTEYLQKLQEKIEAEKLRLENVLLSEKLSKKDSNNYEKIINKIKKQQQEMAKYNELLNHYANMNIDIDLNDGIDENYKKLKEILAKI